MHHLNQKSKKTVVLKKIVFFFSLLLIIIFLVACGEGNDDNYVVTWTPPPSATPTCAPNTHPMTPEVLHLSTRLFVILYDPRTVGDQYLELANGEKTQDIPHFIGNIVPVLMKPSDQVSVFYMGYSSYNDAKVARLYSYTIPPLLYDTPVPRATLTPPPPTTTPNYGYEEVATKNALMKLQIAATATEAENQRIYNCEVKHWNDTIQTTAVAWNSTATAEISEISNNIDLALKEINTNKGKPFSTDELFYGGVYYSLSFASTVFQSSCKEYDDCILLIIDDMHVSGGNNPDNLSINLNGVKTYVVMPNCQDINEPNCKSLEDYWDNEFLKFGAIKPVYWNGIRAEINLLNAVGR